MTNIDGMVIEYALRFNFRASNNQVEYEALIAKLKMLRISMSSTYGYSSILNSSSDNSEENMRSEILFSLNIYKDLSLYNHILITSKFLTSLILRMFELTFYPVLPPLIVAILKKSSLSIPRARVVTQRKKFVRLKSDES